MTECPLCMGDMLHLRARIRFWVEEDGQAPYQVEETVPLYDAVTSPPDSELLGVFCNLHRIMLVPDEWGR